MNSYVLTQGGLSLLIDNKPYVVDQSHISYANVIDAVKRKAFNEIPALLDVRQVLENKFAGSELTVKDKIVRFRGAALGATLQSRIMQMFTHGFDLAPMERFLKNLYNNPSKKAVDELFTWISVNGITISEDGFLLAYKRVQDNFYSFFGNNSVLNAVGTYVEMPRNEVDDRSEHTCSYGLHFCAQSYLPEYAGGQGRVLLLKINPADVVSIPSDYNSAKGRTCKYFVAADLSEVQRQRVEEKDVLVQAVVRDVNDVNATDSYKSAYRAGYKDGRGKQRKFKSLLFSATHTQAQKAIRQGYEAGFADGRHRQPKRFA